jgi:DNA mismatch repair ATPase MutS
MNARITAELDVACGLAKVAEEGGYIRPTIVAESVMLT